MNSKELTAAFHTMKECQYSDPVTSLALSEEIIQTYEKKPFDHLPIAEAYLIRSHHYDYMMMFKESKSDAEYALTIASAADDLQSTARALYQIASAIYSLGDKYDAISMLQRAVEIAKNAHDQIGEGLSLRRLSYMYNDVGLLEKGIEYTRSAYEKLKDTEFEPLALLQVVFSTHDPVLHKDLLQQALAIAEKYNNHISLLYILNEIGDKDSLTRGLIIAQKTKYVFFTQLMMASLAQWEFKHNNYEDAETIVIGILQQNAQTGDLYSNSRLMLLLAQINLSRNRINEAFDNISAAVALIPEGTRINYSADVDELLSLAYEKSGDFEKALVHERKFREKYNQIFSEKSRLQERLLTNLIATKQLMYEKALEAMKRKQLESELSNSTLQLIAQTELLDELRTSLSNIIRKLPAGDSIAKELREKLRILPCKSVDWDRFDMQFKAAHPEFTQKLTAAYPTLTPTELRICTLVRMNLRSDEIARLFCLSERTIESHRYKIRKKMDLAEGADLLKELIQL